MYDVILSHAATSERIGPGSFVQCIESIVDGLKMDRIFFEDRSKKDVEKCISLSRYATYQDVEKFLKLNCHDEILTQALSRAIEEAGFGGRIILEQTSSQIVSVERVKGYTFDLSSAFPIDTVLIDPRVLVIDGMIESVSEIHSVLESSSNAKEPMLMFARGYNSDVINTLKVNFDAGRLMIIPIVVKFDLEGLNTLNDVAVISGGDIISSLKGDLISSVNYSDLRSIDKATVTNGRVTMSASKSGQSVASHIQALLEKRSKNSIEDVELLIDKRLKTLSPSHVVVRIPRNIDVVIAQQSLDRTLRSIRSAMDHGVVDVNETVIPLSSKVSSIVSALKCIRMIDDLGAVITDSV